MQSSLSAYHSHVHLLPQCSGWYLHAEAPSSFRSAGEEMKGAAFHSKPLANKEVKKKKDDQLESFAPHTFERGIPENMALKVPS